MTLGFTLRQSGVEGDGAGEITCIVRSFPWFRPVQESREMKFCKRAARTFTLASNPCNLPVANSGPGVPVQPCDSFEVRALAC